MPDPSSWRRYADPVAEWRRQRSDGSRPDGAGEGSPKDRFLTVYGHRPVEAALADHSLDVDKVLLAEGEDGPAARRIQQAARRRGVEVRRVPASRVKLLAGNGRHDNGVLADVVAPRMRTLDDALRADRPEVILLLDGVRTPANVGMVLRSATAAGLDGVLLPRRGVPAIDPLVIKASAGVAFRAPVLRASTAEEGCAALRSAGITVLGLAGNARRSLMRDPLPARIALVLGNETEGLSEAVRAELDGTVAIPMHGGVESLNVAGAAAVAGYELLRRKSATR